jgi:hypothetical protein
MKSFKIILAGLFLIIIAAAAIHAQDAQTGSGESTVPGAVENSIMRDLQNGFGIRLSPALAGTIVVGTTWRESVRLLSQERMKLTDLFRKSRRSGTGLREAFVAGNAQPVSDAKMISEQIKVSTGSFNPNSLKEIRSFGDMEKMTKFMPDAATLKQAKEITKISNVRKNLPEKPTRLPPK